MVDLPVFELLIISGGSHYSAVIDGIHVSSGNREKDIFKQALSETVTY